mmetsp:Transcript_16086/g.49160  ORF Transcript_16086/g.49160 Transcript_16086/m.49160 type:complete len:321 (-) Transcript_16086:1393-2355(-)
MRALAQRRRARCVEARGAGLVPGSVVRARGQVHVGQRAALPAEHGGAHVALEVARLRVPEPALELGQQGVLIAVEHARTAAGEAARRRVALQIDAADARLPQLPDVHGGGLELVDVDTVVHGTVRAARAHDRPLRPRGEALEPELVEHEVRCEPLECHGDESLGGLPLQLVGGDPVWECEDSCLVLLPQRVERGHVRGPLQQAVELRGQRDRGGEQVGGLAHLRLAATVRDALHREALWVAVPEGVHEGVRHHLVVSVGGLRGLTPRLEDVRHVARRALEHAVIDARSHLQLGSRVGHVDKGGGHEAGDHAQVHVVAVAA